MASHLLYTSDSRRSGAIHMSFVSAIRSVEVMPKIFIPRHITKAEILHPPGMHVAGTLIRQKPYRKFVLRDIYRIALFEVDNQVIGNRLRLPDHGLYFLQLRCVLEL